MSNSRSLYRITIFAMFMVVAGLRPCLAHEVMIVQSSSLAAYQRAANGFNQAFATLSLPGVPSIQQPETVVLDEAAKADAVDTVTRNYQDLQPNLIVAIGSRALEAVKDLPRPVIYLMTPAPEAIIQGRPQITGIRMATSPAAQLAAIQETFPAITKIALLHNPATSGDFPDLARSAAQRLHLSLIAVAAGSDREAIQRLTGMTAEFEAILLTPDPDLITPPLLEALALLSLEERKPLIAFAPKYVEQGAALAIFATPEESGRQAAEMVKRLLFAPGQGGLKPEYAKKATVLTNNHIIRELGLLSAGPAGGERP